MQSCKLISLNHTNLRGCFKLQSTLEFLSSPQAEAAEVTVAELCAKRSLASVSFPGTHDCLLEDSVYSKFLLFPLFPPLQPAFLIIFSFVPIDRARANGVGITFHVWCGVMVTSNH